MRLKPCCLGIVATVLVLAVGASRLDRSTRVQPNASATSAASSSISDPSGESLYQLESVWTTDRGERVRLKDLAGSTEVLAMMFTRCPTLCPTLVHDLKAVEASLRGRARAHTQFLLVTMDPEHDTPQALREFRSRMGLGSEHWTLLCGSEADTRELGAVLGFAYGRGDGKNYTHSNLVTVLDPGGVIVHQQTGLGSDPERALLAIEQSLGH